MARLNEIEAQKIFKPETMDTLKGKSRESLKQLLKDKNLRQVIQRSSGLIPELIEAENGYRDHLELLAAEIATEVYPIIKYANIKIDAKIVPMGDLKIPEEPDEVPIEDVPARAELEKRSIIKKIQQGASVRGAFAFLLFTDYLDALDDELVAKYKEILELSFGIYDNDEALALLLAAIEQKTSSAGGSSEMVYDENDNQFVIKARAICFPMLVHEIIKGLYEIVGTEGFGADKEKNQAIVNAVDKLSGEPDDLRYGKFLYDAIVDLYYNSNVNDDRVREIFMAELFKLPFEELKSFVENAVNGELTPAQKKWATDEMRDIKDDLKKDDTGLSGL